MIRNYALYLIFITFMIGRAWYEIPKGFRATWQRGLDLTDVQPSDIFKLGTMGTVVVPKPVSFEFPGPGQAGPHEKLLLKIPFRANIVAMDSSGYYASGMSGEMRKFEPDGRASWRFVPFPSFGGLRAAAVLDEDQLYFGAGNGWFYALSKASGRPLWFNHLGDQIDHSAAADENSLYVLVKVDVLSKGMRIFLCKLARATGEVVWKTDFLEAPPSQKPFIEAAKIVVALQNGYGLRFSTENGDLIKRELLSLKVLTSESRSNGHVVRPKADEIEVLQVGSP